MTQRLRGAAAVVVAAVACVAVGSAAPHVVAAPDRVPRWARDLWRPEHNGLAATEAVRDGVLLATDYVYDDRGVDSDGEPGGDATYPSGPQYARNAADLAEVRVA